MRIDPSDSKPQPAAAISRLRQTTSRGTPAAGTPPQSLVPPLADRAEISDAASEHAADGPDAAMGAMRAERVSELRQRVRGGAYNSLEVVDRVARRMLERGDV